ncbi:MAG: TauD/TfdA family dioxygenase [Acetobacterales bacterium]
MVKITPLDGPLGADVSGVDVSKELTPAEMGAIHKAWGDYLVLRLRGQKLNNEQLMNFSRLFGALDKRPIHSEQVIDDDKPEMYINVISNVVENGKAIGSLGAGELSWHTDMSYAPVPPMASVLYGVEVPAKGGDTGFCNMYLAYENLPANLKKKIEDKVCIHDASRTSGGKLRQGFKEVTDPREAPGAAHPLVRTHPITGRNALFLGRRLGAYIKGMELADSEVLLDELWEYATADEVCWWQQWKQGDLIMWDNRCTMHRRAEFQPTERRVMHRTQIAGDRPFTV